MIRCRTSKLAPFCAMLIVLFAAPLVAQTTDKVKIAFIADQGLGPDAREVLRLIREEGAEVVLHQGDFDYRDDPAAWEAQINDMLGADFPYLASIGNHDGARWYGDDGYQRLLEDRLDRIGISWKGELGVKASLHYRGIFVVQVAPGIIGSGHAAYIREQLATDRSLWSICSWHKNMGDMQVGGKSDETGWGVYEEAVRGGAIIATGHEHSYSRTHLLRFAPRKTIVNTSDDLVIRKGESFAFVSGLGGASIRDQDRSGTWWASVYTSDQGANPGALFGTFLVDGLSNRAEFYFKDIDGNVVDRFTVFSEVEPFPQARRPHQLRTRCESLSRSRSGRCKR
jgi:predicted phosphodiesterase